MDNPHMAVPLRKPGLVPPFPGTGGLERKAPGSRLR